MDIILYNIIACLAVLIFGYFFGSIPTGVILCRLFKGEDPRNYGSKNSGGTNVGRVFGMKLGAATIILDAIKTVLPMIIVYILLNFAGVKEYFINTFGENFIREGQPLLLLAPLGATIGHCWPIFAHFKGGKAVSSFSGFLLATCWLSFSAFLIAFLLTLKVSKHVSLSSIIGSVSASVFSFVLYLINSVGKIDVGFAFWSQNNNAAWVICSLEFVIAVSLISIILVLRHKSNIKRLVSHQESKIKWMK